MYAIYLTICQMKKVSLQKIFTEIQAPRHKLFDIHTWGCPVYALDPKLQEGNKLQRWQPRSRKGFFVDFSNQHSSDVPLILNLQTSSISAQFHVMFDNNLSTVNSIAENKDPTFLITYN